MKEIWNYIKMGFGMYFGYTLAKYLDQYLGVKYNEHKIKKQEDKYIDNDIKITNELIKDAQGFYTEK